MPLASLRAMIRRKIDMTPRALMKASLQKREIALQGDRFPAAFLISMPFCYIMHRLPQMKLYVPKHKPKKVK